MHAEAHDDAAGARRPLPPDDAHRRPEGVDDVTVEAVGKLSEALEWVERARGRLYDFHQLMGRADFLMEDAAELLDRSGHHTLADEIRTDVVGRNVLHGRWTFQVVEEFDALYYGFVQQAERRVRERLLGGRRHVYEAEMKERRRTPRRAGHESRPGEAGSDGGAG